VIKVESTKRPDPMRLLGTTGGPDPKFVRLTNPNECVSFNDVNLNKLSITLDLTKPKATELAKRIARLSDVIVENNRPGVIARLGLGYEAIKEIKPDIIYLSASTRGATGPERDYAGFAPIFGCLGGLAEITGYPDGPPAPPIVGRADIICGTASVLAIISALIYRERTGEGQYIDLSDSEVISCLIGDIFIDYALNGREQTRTGNKDNVFAPHDCYRCKGDDKWVSIAITNEEEWRAFCHATGNPQWTEDERFSDMYSRKKNEKELDKLISEWTINHTHYEVMDILQNAGVAAVPSLNAAEFFDDPHFKERAIPVEVNHPVIGRKVALNPPWKMSLTPPKIYRHGPLLGEHNDYVFGELLGMSDEEIQKLKEERVIY
jgi:benzylsuccinate CoA-transferase BbsF subunit